jgi:hypothetical protein
MLNGKLRATFTSGHGFSIALEIDWAGTGRYINVTRVEASIPALCSSRFLFTHAENVTDRDLLTDLLMEHAAQ